MRDGAQEGRSPGITWPSSPPGRHFSPEGSRPVAVPSYPVRVEVTEALPALDLEPGDALLGEVEALRQALAAHGLQMQQLVEGGFLLVPLPALAAQTAGVPGVRVVRHRRLAS